MLAQVLKTIKQHGMFEPGEKVVVAVSGGPDSVALLNILKEINIQLCLDMGVAHLDHHLRRGSARDLVFVKRLAKELNLPFFGRQLDWKKIKKQGSLEDQLRRLRYDFLFDACKKFQAKKLALGHTRDDQAETVLMRILRGSGLYGLSAILPRRTQDRIEIVRPLIEISRREVLGYLKKNRLPYRFDSTNLEDKFMRNKIRNDLLPVLESQYNPNIKEVLSNLALIVGADYAYLADQARVFLEKNLDRGRDKYSLPLSVLKGLDISLRRLSLRRVFESLCGDLRRISFQHWQEIEDLIFYRPDGSEVHLPHNISISKTKTRLSISKR
jgi:tRNA(Ile)-lysidine synthase